MTEKPRIGLIIGSTRPTRVCRTVAEWAMKEMEHGLLNLSLIDLAEVNLPFLDEPEIPAHRNYQQEHTKAWSRVINEYDGFVLVFPQYNWGYPAVLKNALDFLYDEWRGKPVSIMCYGGHGGFQATLSMKLVTQGLHMYNIATNPALDISDDMFDESGQFKNIEKDFARYKIPLQSMSSEFASLLVK
ncbi:NAD(P)H-dependent oxidoreductase [Listeria rocourtiae]|uniref:NADPH-dependent FMN reductase n=1 Tax=Listeria rocourtiae TaxID=647910 RepID=UPI003D2F7E77